MSQGDERVALEQVTGTRSVDRWTEAFPLTCANCGFIRLRSAHVLDDPRASTDSTGTAGTDSGPFRSRVFQVLRLDSKPVADFPPPLPVHEQQSELVFGGRRATGHLSRIPLCVSWPRRTVDSTPESGRRS
jgi:hypothetical protein